MFPTESDEVSPGAVSQTSMDSGPGWLEGFLQHGDLE